QLFEYPKVRCSGLSYKINPEVILQGGLFTSLARARILLPLIYLPRLSQKFAYLWRQMFPPHAVMWDFYSSPNLKPTWRNYLRLRRQALSQLFKKNQ
ncbi:MAG TPA: hypothetical protein PK885_11365, partial [Candidatus Marinimicrobia bacterium]|nr:hypothetical protein [Candidatus Neomarinimicrobiota bacterium]